MVFGRKILDDMLLKQMVQVNKLASTGLDNTTMPYIIKNTAKNTFVLEAAVYENRLVGSESF